MSNNNWRSITVGESLEKIPSLPNVKLLSRNYKKKGLYPIIDQGQDAVAGWTDDSAGLISNPLPIIIFGDHTRILKFIDFPFVRGADGTQLLKPRKDIYPLYFFYACRELEIPSRGYNRHFTVLKEKKISLPPYEEQIKIAHTLDRIEKTGATQSKQIELTSSLKRSAMQTLFTRGLRKEAQKETEFGTTPANWQVLQIRDFIKQAQYGLNVRGETKGKYPNLRMNCQEDGKVLLRNLQYVDIDDSTFQAYRLHKNDILFNRTNSYELVGRTAIFEQDADVVFASYLVRVEVDKNRMNPHFLNYFLNWEVTQSELKKLASRGVSQANISAGKLRDFAIPVPPTLKEQNEIVEIFSAIDQKIDLHKRKRIILEALFKSMLHKLMTGEIRVSDLDLSAIEKEVTK